MICVLDNNPTAASANILNPPKTGPSIVLYLGPVSVLSQTSSVRMKSELSLSRSCSFSASSSALNCLLKLVDMHILTAQFLSRYRSC